MEAEHDGDAQRLADERITDGPGALRAPAGAGVLRGSSASANYESYRRTEYFGSLDGLRCFSILAVIWVHTGIPIAGMHLAQQGYLGVDLFFAISGFLITTLLLREREKWGAISLRSFYVRRTLRIFPLYYAVIAIYVIVVKVLEPDTPAGREFFANLPYYLSYTSNWFVDLHGRVIFYFAWSLATEEQFYLVWPAIEKLLRGWRPVLLIAAVLAMQAAARAAAAAGLLPEHALGLVMLLSVHPAILGGAAMAHLLHDPRGFSLVTPVLSAKWTAPVLLVLLLAAAECALPTAWIWLLMVLLVGSVSIREANGLSGLLRWRPIAYVGMVSYGMYLMHMLSYNAAQKVLNAVGFDQPWLAFPATVAVAIVAAAISYRYYESWFLRLKTRFARVRTRHPVIRNPGESRASESVARSLP